MGEAVDLTPLTPLRFPRAGLGGVAQVRTGIYTSSCGRFAFFAERPGWTVYAACWVGPREIEYKQAHPWQRWLDRRHLSSGAPQHPGQVFPRRIDAVRAVHDALSECGWLHPLPWEQPGPHV